MEFMIPDEEIKEAVIEAIDIDEIIADFDPAVYEIVEKRIMGSDLLSGAIDEVISEEIGMIKEVIAREVREAIESFVRRILADSYSARIQALAESATHRFMGGE